MTYTQVKVEHVVSTPHTVQITVRDVKEFIAACTRIGLEDDDVVKFDLSPSTTLDNPYVSLVGVRVVEHGGQPR